MKYSNKDKVYFTYKYYFPKNFYFKDDVKSISLKILSCKI